MHRRDGSRADCRRRRRRGGGERIRRGSRPGIRGERSALRRKNARGCLDSRRVVCEELGRASAAALSAAHLSAAHLSAAHISALRCGVVVFVVEQVHRPPAHLSAVASFSQVHRRRVRVLFRSDSGRFLRRRLRRIERRHRVVPLVQFLSGIREEPSQTLVRGRFVPPQPIPQMIKLGLIRPDESQASLLDGARDDDRQHGLKGELPPRHPRHDVDEGVRRRLRRCRERLEFRRHHQRLRFARLLLVPRARDDDDSLDVFATRRVSRERRVIRVRGRSQLPEHASIHEHQVAFFVRLLRVEVRLVRLGPNLIIFHGAAPQGPAARRRAPHTRAQTHEHIQREVPLVDTDDGTVDGSSKHGADGGVGSGDARARIRRRRSVALEREPAVAREGPLRLRRR